MKYLLDTNIISEPLRPKPSKSVMRLLSEHEDDIAIPAPVWHVAVRLCSTCTVTTTGSNRALY